MPRIRVLRKINNLERFYGCFFENLNYDTHYKGWRMLSWRILWWRMLWWRMLSRMLTWLCFGKLVPQWRIFPDSKNLGYYPQVTQRKSSVSYFYLFFNINIESTNNYITDDFEISKKFLPSGVIFNISSPRREKLVLLKWWCN